LFSIVWLAVNQHLIDLGRFFGGISRTSAKGRLRFFLLFFFLVVEM